MQKYVELLKDVSYADALLIAGDGEVEVIVVVVCLSFLFLTVFFIMLCLQKKGV